MTKHVKKAIYTDQIPLNGGLRTEMHADLLFVSSRGDAASGCHCFLYLDSQY
jgi:hypothetical protein